MLRMPCVAVLALAVGCSGSTPTSTSTSSSTGATSSHVFGSSLGGISAVASVASSSSGSLGAGTSSTSSTGSSTASTSGGLASASTGSSPTASASNSVGATTGRTGTSASSSAAAATSGTSGSSSVTAASTSGSPSATSMGTSSSSAAASSTTSASNTGTTTSSSAAATSSSSSGTPATSSSGGSSTSTPSSSSSGSTSGSVIDAGSPWSHTIAINGIDAFNAGSEQFDTTSTSDGYFAYVTWDQNALYLGYLGSDVGSGSSDRYLFAFIDTNPGAGTGAASSEVFNTQQVDFPAGFGGEFYWKWRADNAGEYFLGYSDSTSVWSVVTPLPTTTEQDGGFVETAIPRASFGNPARIGLITYMMNDTNNEEWTYAGLYMDNFTDGYSPATSPKVLTRYLTIDFSSPNAPNSGGQ